MEGCAAEGRGVSSIANKADYVRRAPQGDSRHGCHWTGCEKRVPPAMWGCRLHWFRLPLRLRNLIWQTYRPGQEISKDPSAAYLEAADQVQAWIAEHGGAT